MKIGLLLAFKEDSVKYLQTQLANHELIQLDTQSDNISAQIKDCEVIIGANAPDEIIATADKLRLFHVPWVGLDRINFDALQKKKVIICNSKWNDRIVAEYALTLLLTAIKQIIPIHEDFKTGSWKKRTITSKLVTNSSVLLIGFGSIGREIAKLLQPFTKEIIALRNDPSKSTPDEKKLVKKIISWDDYKTEITKIDYIINSLPLTPQTTGILTKERLYAMKKGAYYINVGRGKTTDEAGLYEVLQNHHLGGAAIDVWYNYKKPDDIEPVYPSKMPFHELDNIIMSPHRAATFSDTSVEILWSDVIYNIQALASGDKLRNIITYEKRY